MTKAFKLNWHRTVLEELQTGTFVDRWSEVSAFEGSQTVLTQRQKSTLIDDGGKYLSLFINKRFALNEMFQRNASKFAIFYV